MRCNMTTRYNLDGSDSPRHTVTADINTNESTGTAYAHIRVGDSYTITRILDNASIEINLKGITIKGYEFVDNNGEKEPFLRMIAGQEWHLKPWGE